MKDWVRAAVVAGVVSGVPSTLHALVTGRDPLAATLAAGALVLPRERRPLPLVVVAVPVHFAISLWWAFLLSRVLRGRASVVRGALGGVVIAAVDLRLPGRRFAPVRRLALGPQVADHVVFGAVVGGMVR